MRSTQTSRLPQWSIGPLAGGRVSTGLPLRRLLDKRWGVLLRTRFYACGILPSLRSGQAPLDDSDQFLATSKCQRRFAPTPDRFPPGVVIGFRPESLIAFSRFLRGQRIRLKHFKYRSPAQIVK